MDLLLNDITVDVRKTGMQTWNINPTPERRLQRLRSCGRTQDRARGLLEVAKWRGLYQQDAGENSRSERLSLQSNGYKRRRKASSQRRHRRAANGPKIFFIVAEKRWRPCSRRKTSSVVTQLN
jgi:hypothetical protein